MVKLRIYHGRKSQLIVQTFQLITLAVCCGYILGLILHLIGRETINIPEIILSVYCFRVLTVSLHWL